MELTKGQELYQNIISKAWESESFKNELINFPVKTIEDLIGKKLNIPQGKNIIIKDQTDASIVYINIPAKSDMSDVELNEDQLDMVTGGTQDAPIIIDGVAALDQIVGE